MPQAVLISVEEYLRTSYDPDCEYVEGEVLERNLGERGHSTLQLAFGALFHRNRAEWSVVPLTEQRVQVVANRYRVPDVCVIRREDPRDEIIRKAPLICLEVLSPEDTFSRLQTKVDDYVSMGVEHIWVIDPATRRAYVAGPQGFLDLASGEFTVPGTLIRVVVADLFADLDW